MPVSGRMERKCLILGTFEFEIPPRFLYQAGYWKFGFGDQGKDVQVGCRKVILKVITVDACPGRE